MFKKQNEAFTNLSEEEIKNKLEETPLEKNDMMALILAAMRTFIPALLLMLGAFYLIIWFIFLR